MGFEEKEVKGEQLDLVWKLVMLAVLPIWVLDGLRGLINVLK